jgi:hypothetical protein
MKKIIGVIFVACLGWAVWPYYALYDLATALEKNDPISMEHRVEWSQVRQGLRDDLKAMLMDKIRRDASAKTGNTGGLLGSDLALIAGPAIIDGLIEAYVTPPSIAKMIQSGKLDKPTASAQNSEANGSQETEEKHGLTWKALNYAFFSGGPFSFRVEIINKAVEHPVVLLFKWAGDWKLVRIFLPVSLPAGNLESTVLKPMTELLMPTPPKTLASSKFDTKQVEARPDKREATRVAAAPSLGVSNGEAAQLSQSEFDAFRRRLEECWRPPPGVDSTTKLRVLVRVLFNSDGSVARPPEVVSAPTSALGPAMAESAKRAILRCQPFKMLKSEHYEQWKDIEINYDPQYIVRR